MFMRNSGYAPIRFHPHQQRSAIGIGHAGNNADYFPGEICTAFLVGSAAPILIGAHEFQELSTLLLEKKSDFFRAHGCWPVSG
jgi:hypothetical protein